MKLIAKLIFLIGLELLNIQDANDEVMTEFQRNINYDENVICVMLANISPELQIQHTNIDAYTIIMHLNEQFDVANMIERYVTFRELYCYKMTKGSYLNSHVLFMIENYLCTLHSNSQIFDNRCDFFNCKKIIGSKEKQMII